MIWLLSLALAGPMPASSSHDAVESHAPHVVIPPPVTAVPRPVPTTALLGSDARQIRGIDRRADALVAEGVRRSKTFASLVADLHGTDVIVYVEPSHNLPARIGGRLLLQAVTPGGRYVRVQLRATLQKDEILAVLAHELRHALELASDPSVVDERGLVALYGRIGYLSPHTKGYDTQAAKEAGDQVRQELLGAPPYARVAPGV